MTHIDRPNSAPPPDPTGAARAGWYAAGERRRRFAVHVIIALVFLAVGAAGTLMVVRFGHRAPAAQAGMDRAVSQPTPAGQAAGMAGMDVGAPTEPPADAKGPTMYISPARQQLIGVRTAEVTHVALDTTIRTVGALAYDETHVTQIHTKIAGWVDRLYVDYVGKAVRRGQPLFTVYSPELVSTQNEYLLALEAQKRLGGSQFVETRTGAESLLAATRERLMLWDISEAQIVELEQTRQPRKTLTLYSPFTGIVLEKNTFAGQYVTPETVTFKIADLSTIWVLGQVFEYELPMVKVGQEAEIQFPYGQANQSLKGKITFIYPDVDPATRRVRIRIEFRNPGFEFKPDSYVTVVMHTSGGMQLAVPKEAVIDTGAKRYAILAHPNGYFEPREIETGEPVDEYYPVLGGLQHGDKVVTSAQFLIDSETNLQAAMQAMSASMPGMGGTGGGAEGTKTPTPPPPSGQQTPGEHAGHQPAPQAAAPAGLKINVRSQPDPPRTGDNTLEVTVTDAQGQPVTDAAVTVLFFMPAMPSMGMPATRSQVTLSHADGGTYRGTAEVAMAGRWDVTVTVSRAGQRVGGRQLAIVVQ